jgi:hypothetical protein
MPVWSAFRHSFGAPPGLGSHQWRFPHSRDQGHPKWGLPCWKLLRKGARNLQMPHLNIFETSCDICVKHRRVFCGFVWYTNIQSHIEVSGLSVSYVDKWSWTGLNCRHHQALKPMALQVESSEGQFDGWDGWEIYWRGGTWMHWVIVLSYYNICIFI